MFLGRRLKTDLPTTAPLLTSRNNLSDHEIKMRLKTRQTNQKLNYDRHSGPNLRTLHQGEKVVMRNQGTWIPAKVVETHQNPRSYILQNPTGRKYRSNRKHIRPT